MPTVATEPLAGRVRKRRFKNEFADSFREYPRSRKGKFAQRPSFPTCKWSLLFSCPEQFEGSPGLLSQYKFCGQIKYGAALEQF